MGRKTWIGIGVVAFWLVMTALLWQRERGGTRITEFQGPRAAETGSSTWLGLFMADGPQVGHVHLRRTPEQRRGLAGTRFTMNTQMALNMLGRDTNLRVVGAVWRAAEEPLAELDLTVESMEQTLKLDAAVENGKLVGRVESAGEILPLELPMDPEMLLQTGFGTATGFPAMEVGDDFRLEGFDPLTLQKATTRVRCVAEELLEVDGVSLPAKVLEVTTGGFTSKVWVDDAGELIRAETPVGLVLQRLSPERASALAGNAGGGGDLLGLTAVEPTGEKPRRGMEELSLRISGLGDGIEVPTDDHQRFDPSFGAGVLRIAAGGFERSETLHEARRRGLLASDPFIQSDHPRLIDQAREIVGETDDPAEKARLLHDWVFARLDKVPVMSIPSALEVLDSRRGDCNEHTVLFAALARAVDLPTRIAIGLVWSDELDGFYYHAWPEVWLGDRFERFDPTLDQAPADATHIKLLEGGIESWPRLLAFLGRLHIEIVDEPTEKS